MKQPKINIVIFAADAKHLSYLNNIITVASNNNLNIFKPLFFKKRGDFNF